MPHMKVLLLAFLGLLSYSRAKHLLVETVDAGENLPADSSETMAEVMNNLAEEEGAKMGKKGKTV